MSLETKCLPRTSEVLRAKARHPRFDIIGVRERRKLEIGKITWIPKENQASSQGVEDKERPEQPAHRVLSE